MGSRDQLSGLVSRATAATDVRSSLYKRLEDRVNNIASSLQNIIDSAMVDERATNAIGEYQTDIEASNIAQSCEELLRLISDVEIATITQDTDGIIQDVDTKIIPMYQQIVTSTDQTLLELRTSVSKALEELEAHYHASQSRIPLEAVTQ